MENAQNNEKTPVESDPVDILERAELDRQKALAVAEKCGIVAAWKEIGATVSLVGSVRTGLFITTARLDVDFHIYADKIDFERSFAAIGKIAATPGVFRVEYYNFLDAPDRCLQWRVWFADPETENASADDAHKRAEWAIDLVQIVKNSRYDGYFEKVADRISAVLTPETRRAILEIKANLNARPDADQIASVEVYRAVVEGGVRDVATFLDWRAKNPLDGVLEWIP